MTYRDNTVTQRLSRTETETEKEKESSVSFRNGLRASDVVREYARAAKELGNERFLDRTSRAILGAQALRVIRRGDWESDIILRAAQTFAGSQRNPAFFEDWVRTQHAIDQETGSRRRKSAEPRDGGLRSLFSVIDSARLPAAPQEGAQTEHLNNQTKRSGGMADA